MDRLVGRIKSWHQHRWSLCEGRIVLNEDSVVDATDYVSDGNSVVRQLVIPMLGYP
jgi:hypothetical protein